MTRLPAENWKLRHQTVLDPGCHAGIVIFDPRTITDRTTFERPHQLAMGVEAVFVNGVQVVFRDNTPERNQARSSAAWLDRVVERRKRDPGERGRGSPSLP